MTYTGWFLTLPDKNLYDKMYEKALNRTMYPWSENQGWGTQIPGGVYFRGGKEYLFICIDI
jgi:hypothetical protein